MAADPRDLCTVQNVKDALEPPMTTNGRDARIQSLITDASVAIMRRLDRELTPQTASATRRFQIDLDDGGRGTTVDLAPYDLRSTTAVTLHPESSGPLTLVSLTDYVLEPIGKPQGSYYRIRLSDLLFFGSSFSRRFGYALLDVAGAWGIWDTAQVDPDIREACVLTVRAWLRQNPAAYAFPSAQEGAPVQSQVPATWEIPTAAMKKAERFARWAV